MVRPLTKTDSKGDLYTRPSTIDAQIEDALGLSLPDLRTRLLSTERSEPTYLRSECLVHLIREGRRTDNQQLMNIVLPVLLGRCEANLLAKVPDGELPYAADLRQKILERLVDLFLMDGTDDSPNELDFYECRFNRAFRTLRIDEVRRKVREHNQGPTVVELPPSETENDPNAYEDVLARVSESLRVPPTQEWYALRESIAVAIEALHPDECDALMLVHVLGYKVESKDPEEETAATRCKCTGRTIRYRLARAAKRLSCLEENL